MVLPLSDVIPMGEWRPDLPDYLNTGGTEALNVLTEGESYIPFKTLGEVTAALTDRIRGGFSFIASDGVSHTFAGLDDNLYKLNGDGTTWDEVSKSTDAYTTDALGSWDFVAFGDRVVATNDGDVPQSFVVGTSALFADLTGAPVCKSLGIINNFVVTGNNNASPTRVKWSAFDDPTSWTPSATTQADAQDLQDGGPVSAVTGYQNYGVILQERKIRRMEYVGPPAIFNFSVLEENRGTRIPRSVQAYGNLIFFLDEDGFYMFDGVKSIPIGHNKVDDTFLADVDVTYDSLISSAIDPINKMVAWAYAGPNNTDGKNNRIIIYNWADNRWTHSDQESEWIFPAMSVATNLESLDAIYGDLDSIPFSLDSKIFSGGAPVLAGFSTNGILGFFDGVNQAATVTGAETRLNTTGRTYVDRVLPVTDATSANITTSLGNRNVLSDSVTYTTGASASAETGESYFRNDARYHRARIVIASGASWNHLQGIQFGAKPTGVR